VAVTFADGRKASGDLGLAVLRIDGSSVGVMVLFGESSDMPVLGATALESARLAVDPGEQATGPDPGDHRVRPCRETGISPIGAGAGG
jgi:predicted aspartyl protease